MDEHASVELSVASRGFDRQASGRVSFYGDGYNAKCASCGLSHGLASHRRCEDCRSGRDARHWRLRRLSPGGLLIAAVRSAVRRRTKSSDGPYEVECLPPELRRHQPRAIGLRATCGERWTWSCMARCNATCVPPWLPAALHFAQACSSALRSDRSFLISKCRYEENPNDPPNCPPTSVLLVLKLKFYTKIFALYSRR
jgi:hypothetical protein